MALRSMRGALRALAFIGFTATAGLAVAAAPLVDVNWVRANGAKPGVVLLDVQSPGAYRAGHIPGAANTDFAMEDGWRVERNGVPDMLNDTPKLEKLIGSLGIDNATHVVLVAGGTSAGDMGVATRIYWTFKILGHDEVSIMNGGMRAWTADKTAPVAKGEEKPAAKTFKATAFRSEMLATKQDVEKALKNGTTLIDSRPEDQYAGVNRNPKAKRNGTLPGAINVPNSWMTENNGGKFRDPATIRSLVASAKAPLEGEQITFCNTGHLASVGWFVGHELLGNKKVKMYDGSMVEWTQDPSAPVEQKIRF